MVMSSGRRPSTPWPYNAVVFAKARCVCTTPFGRPVVPPLNSQIAASSRCESKGAAAGGVTRSRDNSSAPPAA
jgi:hypothetical protein